MGAGGAGELRHMAQQDIGAVIEQEMLRWAGVYIAERKAFLRSRKIDATGGLSESIAAEMNRQVAREVKELLIEFEEHGRYIDMKRLNTSGGGVDYLTALAAWIQRKGLEQRFTNGFLKKYNLKRTPQDVLNRMAWGIAIARNKGKYRRRQWYNKPKSRAISDLYNNVAERLLDTVSSNIAQQLSEK